MVIAIPKIALSLRSGSGYVILASLKYKNKRRLDDSNVFNLPKDSTEIESVITNQDRQKKTQSPHPALHVVKPPPLEVAWSHPRFTVKQRS
jgi:hypothetical protein